MLVTEQDEDKGGGTTHLFPIPTTSLAGKTRAIIRKTANGLDTQTPLPNTSRPHPHSTNNASMDNTAPATPPNTRRIQYLHRRLQPSKADIFIMAEIGQQKYPRTIATAGMVITPADDT